MNNSLTGFLGTYASPESLGIYRFTIDLRNGAMSYPELYYEAPDCKYLSLRDSMLASPLKREGRSGICLLDTAHNKEEALLNRQRNALVSPRRPATRPRMTAIYTRPTTMKVPY